MREGGRGEERRSSTWWRPIDGAALALADDGATVRRRTGESERDRERVRESGEHRVCGGSVCRCGR